MDLNRTQFLRAVQREQDLLEELNKDYPELKLKAVFSHGGPDTKQCELTTDLRVLVLNALEVFVFPSSIRPFRELLMDLQNHPQDAELETEAVEVEKIFLHPAIEIYRGDVLVEFRSGIFKYESLCRLQQDPRLPPDLNEGGSIRVVAGSLDLLVVSGL